MVKSLCSPGFAVSLAGVDPKQEQVGYNGAVAVVVVVDLVVVFRKFSSLESEWLEMLGVVNSLIILALP